MKYDQDFNVQDLRAILALANQMHDLSADAGLRRQTLLEGLCRLTDSIGAVSVIGPIACATGTHRGCAQNNVVAVGFGDRLQCAAVKRYYRLPRSPNLMAKAVMRMGRHRADGRLITVSRRMAVDDESWYADPSVRDLRLKCWGVDDCLYSLFPFSKGRGGWICLHRARSQRVPYTSRHVALVHTFHSELDWFYRAAPAIGSDDRDGRLTVRQRQTLDRLLAGDSEKQVAAELGVSRHTVHVHIKSIYRHYGVHSRNELLAKFVRQPDP
jgi:DNA-binding CsgD family transcriptional regulator